jgi:hypothetical protein
MFIYLFSEILAIGTSSNVVLPQNKRSVCTMSIFPFTRESQFAPQKISRKYVASKHIYLVSVLVRMFLVGIPLFIYFSKGMHSSHKRFSPVSITQKYFGPVDTSILQGREHILLIGFCLECTYAFESTICL